MYEPTDEHIAMWRRGWSCNRIAESAGMCRATICRGMKRKGFDLSKRPNPTIEESIKECWRLKAEGVVMNDIAHIVGWSRRQVQRWLNQKNSAP